jgi:hypothetical protein
MHHHLAPPQCVDDVLGLIVRLPMTPRAEEWKQLRVRRCVELAVKVTLPHPRKPMADARTMAVLAALVTAVCRPLTSLPLRFAVGSLGGWCRCIGAGIEYPETPPRSASHCGRTTQLHTSNQFDTPQDPESAPACVGLSWSRHTTLRLDNDLCPSRNTSRATEHRSDAHAIPTLPR